MAAMVRVIARSTAPAGPPVKIPVVMSQAGTVTWTIPLATIWNPAPSEVRRTPRSRYHSTRSAAVRDLVTQANVAAS
jgi:hypothetical protein